jgi:hypothetical protein
MLKRKNIYVIILSVVIVSLVTLSSFLGLIIYIQWQQLDLAYKYYETLEELDTLAYAKNVGIDSLRVKSGLENLCMLDGLLKNKGKKTILSLALKINFLDSLDNSIYDYTSYPLESLHPPRIFRKMRLGRLLPLKGPLIKPNETVPFKCTLWNCPRRFVKMLAKNKFSNKPGEWSGKITAQVIRVKLKPL